MKGHERNQIYVSSEVIIQWKPDFDLGNYYNKDKSGQCCIG